MEDWLLNFYEVFDIKPINNSYWFGTFGTYPPITADVILQLEDMLLDLDRDCSIEIYKQYVEEYKQRLYCIGVVENNYDNCGDSYHHGFSDPCTTRLQALLSYLIHYVYNVDIYNGVRKVLKQGNPEKQIICFLGRAGSGKDYQCSLLQEKGYIKLAFADALRDIAFSALGVDKEWGMINYEKIKADDEFIKVKGIYTCTCLSFRKFLELLGTQGIRKYDTDFWINALCNTISKQDLKQVCISDMRFINEYEKLRQFAQENEYDFKCIFCDYHSERYQEHNEHESVWLANKLCSLGFKDQQVIKYTDIKSIKNQV